MATEKREIQRSNSGSVSSESYYSDEDVDESSEYGSADLGPNDDARDEEKEVQNIIKNETRRVQLWRLVVMGVLLITATVVTVTTYKFLSGEEVDDFASGFGARALAIASSTEERITGLVATFEGFSDVMTSFAKASDADWPKFTLPDFEEHGRHIIDTTPTEAVWTSPIVTNDTRTGWETYSVQQSTAFVSPKIFSLVDGVYAISPDPGPFLPIWQTAPNNPETGQSPTSLVNFDLFADNTTDTPLTTIADTLDAAVISGVIPLESFLEFFEAGEEEDHVLENGEELPHSAFLQPIYNSFEDDREIVSYIEAIVSWEEVFAGVVFPGSKKGDIYCVLQNTCEQSFTWAVSASGIEYEGKGDLHEPQFNEYRVTADLRLYSNATAAMEAGACLYSFDIYPSSSLWSSYESNKPAIYTSIVGIVFLLVAATFYVYDKFIQRRNSKIITAAARSNAIVSALFPSNVRDRLFDNSKENEKQDKRYLAPKSGLKDFLTDDTGAPALDEMHVFRTKPIADLFPETSIMFADLVGFTAWSSVREPSQVFTLLETVYHAFDQIAKQRRIFKVETVGDCYVAVAGLPEARKDHAVAMVKFANECLKKIHALTKRLEVELGPDTGELTVRVGVHSGPVTAGVLRGERSRFQLFGDTMNTAARMESTGEKDKIQISQDTADLLVAAGKSNWIKPREDIVEAKGKGKMQTYWVDISKRHGAQSTVSSNESRTTGDESETAAANAAAMQFDEEELMGNGKVQRLMSDKTSRLIDWNTDVLARLLKQIVATRKEGDAKDREAPVHVDTGKTAMEEVKEIIRLPEFDVTAEGRRRDPDDIELGDQVEQQLHDYISNIAIMYHENPFHSFEHASHVTMSVTKLMSRIVAPSDVLGDIEDDEGKDPDHKDMASTLHDHTYGITSDPLTQFAVVLSALVHDVDHTGVPNGTLVKENSKIAALYNGKSVAEQNSVDLSWDLLMDDSYGDLRAVIYSTSSELKRFRQLVVNTVMATDIMDKDLKALRNARWDKAFKDISAAENDRDVVNRKATIVIEHIIQASDVAHTMQHWHIYRKWNERLFQEMYLAYQTGRAETDPSEFWYQGEIGFFDFYIIPLAKKLKDCGVFGVSSDEYLNYAMKNRKEWESRGQEVVAEMKEAVTLKAAKVPEFAPTTIEKPTLKSATAGVA